LPVTLQALAIARFADSIVTIREEFRFLIVVPRIGNLVRQPIASTVDVLGR